MEYNETLVVVDMIDKSSVNIITGNSNNRAGIQSEIKVLVQKNITVRIIKQKKEDIAKIDNILLAVRRLRRKSKSIWRLLKLRKFLSKKAVENKILDVFAVKVGKVDIFQIFYEVMKDSDV